MVKCQYCDKEMVKGIVMHERFCKNKVIVAQDAPEQTIEPKIDIPIQPIKQINQEPSGEEKTKSNWISRLFRANKKKEMVEVKSPEELIEGLPSYKIPENSPKSGVLGKIFNRKKDFIQVVLVSEIIEPKTFWAEKKGINRIQFQDRMFKLPRDIRGNVFFWHIDKKEALVDTADAHESDAESSFHELQLFNMAYSVGRAAGANDLLNNLKLILLIAGFGVLVSIAVIVYLSQVEKGLHTENQQIFDALYNMNQSIPR